MLREHTPTGRALPNPAGGRFVTQTALQLLFAVVTLTGSGCNFDMFGSRSNNLKPIQQNLSDRDLIEHVNRNARQLHSWSCTSATISTRPSKMLPIQLTLSAVVAVERERHFRLRASSPFGDEADFGSNDERFWFWLRRSDPAYLYTSEHRHMHLVAERLPIPLQPEWIMEALGVNEIDPSQVVSSRPGTEAGTLALTLQGVSPGGMPIRRELILDTRLGVISKHRLFGQSGGLIAEARMSRHQREPSGVVMPHRIELNFPQSETSLTLDLGEIEINPSGMPGAMWELPQNLDTPTFDIGQRLSRSNASSATHHGAVSAGNARRPRRAAPPFDKPPFAQTVEAPPFDTPSSAANSELPPAAVQFADASNDVATAAHASPGWQPTKRAEAPPWNAPVDNPPGTRFLNNREPPPFD